MMKNEDAFFGAAKKLCLTPEEKADVLGKLRNAVRNAPDTRHQFTMDEHTFLQTAKAIALTPRERVTIRESLLARMGTAAVQSWWLSPFKSFTTVTASVLIVSIAGAGVSYAAEAAMPGDLLYPVKMHVNENLEARIARTPKARAAVATKHAEKRLKEAEMLAQKSALDPKKEAMLASEVERNVRTVQTEVSALMDENDMENAGTISMGLEATLHAHAKFLAKLNENHARNDMTALMDTLREARMDIEESNVVVSMMETEQPVHIAAAGLAADTGRSPQPTTKAGKKDDQKKARKALRKAKEEALIASMPADEAVTIAPAPAVMMMKAEITTGAAVNTEDTDETDSDREDTHFDAAVRMRMTEKKLQKLREKLDHRGREMPEGKTQPVETRVNGSKQLMDMAKIQMDEGNMDEALDASDAALRHAETATRELKEMMPDNED